mgnify:CR=1 FL=1
MVRPTFQTTSIRSTTPNLGSGHGTTKKKIVRFTNSTRDTPRTLPKNSGEQITNQYTGPTTRSRDNTLPPPINRFTAMVNAPQDEVTQIARQPPMDLTSLWEAITHYPTTQPSQRNLGRYSPKTNFRSLNNKGETCANHPSVKLCSTFRTNNNKEPPYPSHRSTQWTYPTSSTLNTMRNPPQPRDKNILPYYSKRDSPCEHNLPTRCTSSYQF